MGAKLNSNFACAKNSVNEDRNQQQFKLCGFAIDAMINNFEHMV